MKKNSINISAIFHNKKLRSTCILTLLCFFMFSIYWNDAFFASDEGEIFVIGHSLARGLKMYSNIASQHTPIMYYIAALFSLFGASSIASFRLCFYGLMALMWGIMYYRYSDHFGKATLIFYPVIYIGVLVHISMGYAILSDAMQGIGMVMLLNELLLFEQRRKLSIDNMIIISLAIFISFGSAFVSAFAIFYVVFTVLALVINQKIKDKTGFIMAVRQIFSEYWKLVAIIIAPLALLFLYYCITGSLKDFIGWTYRINIDVYSKYIGGYGSNILQSLLGGILGIVGYASTFPQNLQSFSFSLLLCGFLFFILIIKKERKNLILTLGLVFFLIGCATRGLFDFHGLAAVAVLSFASAYSLNYFSKEILKSIPKQFVVTGLLVIFFSPYISKCYSGIVSLRDIMSTANNCSPHPYTRYINLITEKNEMVGLNTFDNQAIFTTHTVPSKVNFAVAWFWDFGGEEMMDIYRNSPPRVIIYDPGYAVWGYSITEYASEFDNFIRENYTPLSDLQCNTLYIRNDYYPTALTLIQDDYIRKTGSGDSLLHIGVNNENGTLDIGLYGLETKAISFAVWSDENGQDDLQWYAANHNEIGNWTYNVNLKDHASLGNYNIHVYDVSENQEPKLLTTSTVTISSIP